MFSFCEQDVKRDELILAIAVLSTCKLDIHRTTGQVFPMRGVTARERGARVGDSRTQRSGVGRRFPTSEGLWFSIEGDRLLFPSTEYIMCASHRCYLAAPLRYAARRSKAVALCAFIYLPFSASLRTEVVLRKDQKRHFSAALRYSRAVPFLGVFAPPLAPRSASLHAVREERRERKKEER